MLQKLDTVHLNRLALADALATLREGDFDMREPRRCICGHALRMFGERGVDVDCTQVVVACGCCVLCWMASASH